MPSLTLYEEMPPLPELEMAHGEQPDEGASGRGDSSLAVGHGINPGEMLVIAAFEYPAELDPMAGIPEEEAESKESEKLLLESVSVSEQERTDLKELEQRLRSEMDLRVKQESERAFEAGRKRGQDEGHQAEREQGVEARTKMEQERRHQAAELVENFGRARDQYLHRVEEEVVALALAVAARILRREAQMDPLLLTGAVRVALNQLGATTKLKLHVPEADLGMWQEAMALVPGLEIRPVLVGESEMRLGDCVVETDLGSVDLGIRAQLSEIERGFFDRASVRRPTQVEAERDTEGGR